MNLVGVFHTEGAGCLMNYNHRRRSRDDVIPVATVRVACLASIGYFWPPRTPINVSKEFPNRQTDLLLIASVAVTKMRFVAVDR